MPDFTLCDCAVPVTVTVTVTVTVAMTVTVTATVAVAVAVTDRCLQSDGMPDRHRSTDTFLLFIYLQAYDRDLFPGGCVDDAVDAERYTVPCQLTPRTAFDIMGLTIRTGAWRYSLYCKWDGKLLQPDLDSCPREELFDHRDDTALYDVDSDSGAEHRNVAADPANAAAKAVLLLQLRRRFE